MSETIEKIYCTPTSESNNDALLATLANQQNNPAMMAMMANGGMNNWQNNPFIYLVWMMFANRMWGNNDGTSSGENTNSRAIAALQDTVNTNHNNDLVMQAMSNNQDAIRELAQTFNTDISTIQQACCNINAAVTSVGGQVGFSAERVINAVNLGDQNITSKLCECCCNTQKAILTQGYENQLATERQTNTLSAQMASDHASDQLQDCQYHGQTMSRIDQLANGVQQGFAQIGYQSQANLTSLLQNGNANTQRIIDTLNSHWQADLQQRYQDAKLELSQLNQNATLIAALKTTTTTTA